MQPNLFASPVPRDDSYRILARLAHGGQLPPRAGGWRIDARLKARLAVTAALLSLGALAWAWLPSAHAPQPSVPMAAEVSAPLPGPAPTPRQPVAASEPQAATIVSQAELPAAHTAAIAPPSNSPADAAASASAAPVGKPGAMARDPAKQARRAPTPAASPVRGTAPVESDEDVTLLAAMLKHAKPQKPPVTPPPKN